MRMYRIATAQALGKVALFYCRTVVSEQSRLKSAAITTAAVIAHRPSKTDCLGAPRLRNVQRASDTATSLSGSDGKCNMILA